MFRRWRNVLCNSRIAASYQTLGEIAELPATAKITKSGNKEFSYVLNTKLQKVLAFVVYSCYK